MSQDDFKRVSSHSKDMTGFLVVKDTRDYYTKMHQLQQREDQLGYCKVNCCHKLANFITRDTTSCLDEFNNIVVFSFCFGWLLYLLAALFLMPFLLMYNCFTSCLTWCHRRNSRTSRILDLYHSYRDKIADVYGNK